MKHYLASAVPAALLSLSMSWGTAAPLSHFWLQFHEAEIDKFVTPLPRPPVIHVGPDGPSEITLRLQPLTTEFYPGLPAATVWGYEGSSPGPTIEVESGHALRVHWKNELPTKHLLPHTDDMGGMGHDGMGGMGQHHPTLPEVRNVTHLHGAAVRDDDPMDRLHNNDGWPDAWNVPGQEQIADYPNEQAARALWYHDHAMGSTARNVYAGLIGLYLIRDAFERSLNLPAGEFEVPLILQARGLNDDGSLYYPSSGHLEFYGNTLPVNGKVWPYLEVEPRKYRFRILNASNARPIQLKLVDALDETQPGPAFHQIGSDSGFLERTITLNDPRDPASKRLLLAPAERADIIIDFSGYEGRQLLLHNNEFTDIEEGELPLPDVMLVRVKPKLSALDTSSLPDRIRPIPRLSPADAAQTRRIVLNQSVMPDGSLMMMLNGQHWDDPITEKPVLGTTEVWELVNTLPDVHPFHVHLVDFQVLDRTPFDVAAFEKTGQVRLTGEPLAPEPGESGWKDTVRATPGVITRIIMRFAPYPGYYVYHCHILEHEDMDMMRPFQVVTP